MDKRLKKIFCDLKSWCDTKSKKREYNRLIKTFTEGQVVTPIDGRNLIQVDLPDGVYSGSYNDFQFTSTDGQIQLRFASSSFGDTEFQAIVEVLNGVAAIYNLETYQY